MAENQLIVGILGLGIIGSRVADNVRAAGHGVYVWNRTPKPMPNFMGSPAAVAEVARLIQIFVRDDQALMEVLQQMKPALTRQHLVINHATVSREATLAAAAFCDELGVDFLDAPFTGSKMAAQNGKLVYYVGGPAPLLARARRVLEASSTKILPMGEVGDATVVKITTNLVSAAIVKAVQEAAAITQGCGVAVPRLLEALEANANFSPVIGMKLPAMMAGDFEPHFSLKNMLKDAEFAQMLAKQVGVSASVLDATAAAMRAKLDEGKGELDFSVLGEGVASGVAKS